MARQRKRIRNLRETDQDASLATIVLAQLKASQMRRIAEFERLEDELACLSSQSVSSELEPNPSVELIGACRSRATSGAQVTKVE